jgi:hypothetical protein
LEDILQKNQFSSRFKIHSQEVFTGSGSSASLLNNCTILRMRMTDCDTYD